MSDLFFLKGTQLLLVRAGVPKGVVDFGDAGDELQIWDAETGKLVRELRPSDGDWELQRPAVARDGTLIAAVPRPTPRNLVNIPKPLMTVWNGEDGSRYTIPVGPGIPSDHPVLSSDGRWLVAPNERAPLSIWDTEKRRWALPPEEGAPGTRSVAFSDDGRWLAVVRSDFVVELRMAPRFAVARTFGDLKTARGDRWFPTDFRFTDGGAHALIAEFTRRGSDGWVFSWATSSLTAPRGEAELGGFFEDAVVSGSQQERILMFLRVGGMVRERLSMWRVDAPGQLSRMWQQSAGTCQAAVYCPLHPDELLTADNPDFAWRGPAAIHIRDAATGTVRRTIRALGQ